MFEAPGTRSYCGIRTVAGAEPLQLELPFLSQVNSLARDGSYFTFSNPCIIIQLLRFDLWCL